MILINCTPGMKSVCENANSAQEMWELLYHHCEGSGPTVYRTQLLKLVSMKVTTYNTVHDYITDFRHTLERLTQVLDEGDKLPVYMAALLFVEGLSSKYQVWAERQRAAQREKEVNDRPTLQQLIADIEDEARRNNVKGKGSVSDNKTLYTNKSTGDAKGNKKKDLKQCTGCGDPKPKHTPEKCYATNAELRKAWEEKSGKTYVPYKEYKKKQNEKKGDKTSENSEDQHTL